MNSSGNGVFVVMQTTDAGGIRPATGEGFAVSIALQKPVVPVRVVPLADGIGNRESPVPERTIFIECFDDRYAGLLTPGASRIRIAVA